jgi:hypothetical protein
MVTQRYMQCLINLLYYAPTRGFSVSVELLGYDSLIPRARNTLVAKFLDKAEATHLIFIDADIGFEPGQIERMLRFGRDVVAGMYPLKLIEWNAAVLRRLEVGEPFESATLRYVGTPHTGDKAEFEQGFVTGDFAGAGFLMIKREALAQMALAMPETKYAAAHNFTEPAASNNFHALFECMIDPETREYLSEDYAFCARWRALGGKVWLDTQSTLMHVGPREFRGDTRVRFGG